VLIVLIVWFCFQKDYEKMTEDMVTVGQAAKYCGVSRKTLFRQVKSGKIKASRTPGGHYRILKKDLESFILEKGMYPLAHNHSSRKKFSSLMMIPRSGSCLPGPSNLTSMKRKRRQAASRPGPRFLSSNPALWFWT